MAAAPLCHVTPFVPFGAPRRGCRRPGGTSGGRRGREGAPGEGAVTDGGARRLPAPGVSPLPAGGESGEKMAAILCLRRGEGGGPGAGGMVGPGRVGGGLTYRLLFLLHARGHLRHGPVNGGIFGQVRQVLAAEDGQRFGRIQRPGPERQFAHVRRRWRLRLGRGGRQQARSELRAGPRRAISWRDRGSPGGAGRTPTRGPAAPAGAAGLGAGSAPPPLRFRSIRHGQHGGH